MKPTKSAKNKAQAMVEFAIALPILLLLLYGIIEVSRLLFLYTTVVTASRQAARYGSTTGESAGGVLRYDDCAGIRETAKRFGILGRFDDNEITIQYDKGPNTSIFDQCTGSSDNIDIEGNANRIVVTVQDQFVPLVRLVPLSPRTLSATSSRTIITGVPIVLNPGEEAAPLQARTAMHITSDNPDPSEIGDFVTVHFWVENLDDNTRPPTGEVTIDGGEAGAKCVITLISADNGTGSCNMIFNTVGAKQIVGIFSGNEEFLYSDTAEAHFVNLANTVTTITSDSPDPSTTDQNVAVFVTVTGGVTKPTGTVQVSGGGNIKCTITLFDGAGSCSISFNNTGSKTITASYAGDSTHNPSSDTEPHQVLQGTPTPTTIPTSTAIPTSTPMPTSTPLPPTPLASCNLTNGLLVISGNTLTMSINNQTGIPLEVANVAIQWNHDKGHDTGIDKTLILQSVSLAGVTFYTGYNLGPYVSITPSVAVNIPPGTSTIVFTFHQSYDDWDGTELVEVTPLNLGCQKLTQTQH